MEKQIYQALAKVMDPETKQGLVATDRIKNFRVLGNNVQFTVLLPNPQLKAHLELEINQALKKVPNLGSVKIFFETPHTHDHGHHHEHDHAHEDQPRLSARHILAVASAKGGVGKSTLAINLAIALSHLGNRVGVLDADIYGPSLPTLLGLKNMPPSLNENKTKMIPHEKFGIKSMSVGYLMGEQDAAILRGPMVGKLIQQFVDDVEWGELDYLVIDLPPGTGDTQLSLTQLLQISGAIIVTTPQEIALADVVRGIQMFRKVNTPIIGIIENMSQFECPHCHEITEIFSTGGGMLQSKKLGIPFLGSIPIDLATRISSDDGIPIVHANPTGKIGAIFKAIAQEIESKTEVAASPPIMIKL